MGVIDIKCCKIILYDESTTSFFLLQIFVIKHYFPFFTDYFFKLWGVIGAFFNQKCYR